MELTFIIPMYNIEDYIEKTLYSLINQTVKKFEVILVDDGSTDKTYKKACDFLSKVQFENYKIIKQSNGGVSSARNRGLTEAKGDYVIFLDGDDYVSNNLVEILNKYISEQPYEIIYWGYNQVNENKEVIANYFEKYSNKQKGMIGNDVIKAIFSGTTKIWTGSVVYRKEFLEKYNFCYTEGCANGEDQEFTFKCLCRAKNVFFINEVLSFYVKRNGSISNSYSLKKFDSIYAIKRTYEFIDKVEGDELKVFSNYLKNVQIIKSYLGIINDCIRFINGKRFHRKKSINKLLNEIEEAYPNLTQEMYQNVKKQKGTRDIRIISMKLFLKYPLVYSYLLTLRDKLITLKNRKAIVSN